MFIKMWHFTLILTVVCFLFVLVPGKGDGQELAGFGFIVFGIIFLFATIVLRPTKKD